MVLAHARGLTLVAVEASFYFAGALAPAIVYSSVREPDEMPLDDPAAFARDVQFVFDDPTSFADSRRDGHRRRSRRRRWRRGGGPLARRRRPPGGSNSQSRATYHPVGVRRERVVRVPDAKASSAPRRESRSRRLSGFDSVVGFDSATGTSSAGRTAGAFVSSIPMRRARQFMPWL